ncbi:Uncharacterised protein [Paenibacillus thiaminolyticus]|nr:Uncharacterised protein [Paenibacillus thiaminolyticus]
MLKDFQIRVLARACVTRYNLGEGDMDTIISSYHLTAPDSERVIAYVYSQRPDIRPQA